MKRAVRILLPPMALDRQSARPLYLQLCDRLRAAMAQGDLQTGARLPSTRALARRLGVSRNTVLCAYEELAADGRVTTRVGSGTCVGTATRGRRPKVSASGMARRFLREAQYPAGAIALHDPDGNALYFHS